jgi:hypothetical protein
LNRGKRVCSHRSCPSQPTDRVADGAMARHG